MTQFSSAPQQPPPLLSSPLPIATKNSKPRLIAAGIALAALVIGTLAYFTFQYFLLKSQLSQPTPSPTPLGINASPLPVSAKQFATSLETYKDTVYNFQIDVPAQWFYYPTSGLRNGSSNGIQADTFTMATYDTDDPSNFFSDKVSNPIQINISVDNTQDDRSIEEIISQWQKDDPTFNPVNRSISLGGQSAIISSIEDTYMGITSKTPQNTILTIRINAWKGLAQNQKIIDTILSTFKFLGQGL